MRTLILYHSKTGSTKSYAERIAEAVKGDLMSFKKYKRGMFDGYDTIVFGSRVIGGRIQKVDDFLMHYDEIKEKNVIVFAVGMSFVTADSRKNLISSNLLDLYHIRFYQLRGSFDYQKLSFLEKFMMSNSLRMIANDPNAPASQQSLLTLKGTPIEFDDQAGVDKIISIVNKVNTVIADVVA